jgi:exosortase
MWLWDAWINPNSFYSYCIVVPFISVLLIYQKITTVGFKLKDLAFPIGFLIFMFPLPSEITSVISSHLKFFSANLSRIILNFMFIPATDQGNVIHLPHGTVIVNDACSGIRAIISLFAMGTVFAYWMKTNIVKKAILLLTVFPIAIFVNALRISFISIVTEFWGAKYTGGFIHELAGLLLFGLGFFLLLIMKRILSITYFKATTAGTF